MPAADKIGEDDGVSNFVFVIFPLTLGNVPWVTLGLPPEDALDPWGNRLVYQTFSKVSTPLAATPSPTNSNDGIHSWSGADPNAYSLTSDGPDATPTTADDFTIVTKPTPPMLGVMAGAGVPVD